MSQYCFSLKKKIKNTEVNALKLFIQELYKKKYQNAIRSRKRDEKKLPFIILYANKKVCVHMTSRSKKILSIIESINKKFTLKQLQFGDIQLSFPVKFSVESQKWWNKCNLKKTGNRWNTLEHNGPYFPEAYVKRNLTVYYNNEKLNLTAKEEQVLGFWAQRLLSEKKGGVTEILTQDKVFQKNYFKDLKKYLSKENKKLVKNLSKLDFSEIVDELESLKEQKPTDKDKLEKKIKLEERKLTYGYAYIDGHLEKVGNSSVELPGLFMGRGKNPLRGKIKPDIKQKDVVLNCSKCPKGNWKEKIKNKQSIWLAKWKDPITGNIKYVLFSAEGKFKGECDLLKYEKARKLYKHISKIRKKYEKDIKSSNITKKELGTVLYLIDHYGIRAGNEKKADEADTVGASTLRVEHIKLQSPDKIKFDFLGKDSVKYKKTIKAPLDVFNSFKILLENKQGKDKVFSHITSKKVNDYLKTIDKNFTAKVFRTHLASNIMFDALKKVHIPNNSTKTKTKKLFNKANVKVADVLNHARTLSKKMKESLAKAENELKELKSQKRKAKDKEKLDKKIIKKKEQIEAKKDVQHVAVNTSLQNYIDPRLVVAWAKKEDVDISAIYSSTMKKKFQWAIDSTDKDFDYRNNKLLGIKKLEPQTKSR